MPEPDAQTPTYDALPLKKRQWVDLLLRHGMIGTEASRRMGYQAPEQHAWRMSKNVDVRAAIRERLDESAMQAHEVLFHLSEIARGTLGQLIEIRDRRVWLLDLEAAADAGKLGLIKKLKEGRHGTEIELYSRLDALKELARIRGLTGPKGTEDDPIHTTQKQVIVIGGTEVQF